MTAYWLPPSRPDEDFRLRSRTRRGLVYPMKRVNGYAVHQGLGCDGEIFNGVLGCWHAKDYSMTNSIVPYKSQVPSRIEFNAEQVRVIKNTICRGASDNELGLFLATCRRTGLDPFLKQIHCVMRNVRAGDSYERQMTIQVGIDGYRVLRDRITDAAGDSIFAGLEGPQWSKDGERWLDYPYDDRPAFARVGVYRRGIDRPFVAVCRWSAYADPNNAMWKKMGAEQLAKCAEALAYRRAFPTEMMQLPSGAIADIEPLDEGEIEAIDYIDEEPQRQVGTEAGGVTESPTGAAASPDDEDPRAEESGLTAAPAASAIASPAASPIALRAYADAIADYWRRFEAAPVDVKRTVVNELVRSHRWAHVDGGYNPPVAVRRGNASEAEQVALLEYLETTPL